MYRFWLNSSQQNNNFSQTFIFSKKSCYSGTGFNWICWETWRSKGMGGWENADMAEKGKREGLGKCWHWLTKGGGGSGPSIFGWHNLWRAPYIQQCKLKMFFIPKKISVINTPNFVNYSEQLTMHTIIYTDKLSALYNTMHRVYSVHPQTLYIQSLSPSPYTTRCPPV